MPESRTFKDVFTFIPFVIILLIPLSPIGHVLVFGAIQRFFPDFFPSCFTEQRQNLLQLYETAEYSELVINETWSVSDSLFFLLVWLLLCRAVLHFGMICTLTTGEALSILGSNYFCYCQYPSKVILQRSRIPKA